MTERESMASAETLVSARAGEHGLELDPGAPELPGRLIGRYIVIRELGSGGMGVVFAAYDPELDRKVALKLIKPGPGDLASARKRMQREAQALAKLDHPNVVSVFDVGIHDNQLFVAMEFVKGRTLGAWMKQAEGPQPWPEVLAVFTAAGRGLAAAHAAALIHRDFKPDNVMIGEDGRVRVMDFGLARIGYGDEREPVTASIEQLRAPIDRLTQTGAMLGTPAYMSSEQFLAGPTDARSDQFSFCVALYEALYGERPFAGHNVAALLSSIEREDVRPAPAGARVPGWLREVVVRGLARDPDARHESMQALLDALEADPVARRRKWAARVGLVLGAVASVWGLGVLWTKNIEQDAVIEEQTERLERQNAELLDQQAKLQEELRIQKGMRASVLAGIPGSELEALRVAVEGAGSLEPDAALPAPLVAGLTSALTSIERGIVLLGHKDRVDAVAFSPDGARVATASWDKTIRVWDARSGALSRVLYGHGGRVHALAFSPDGAWIASASEDATARIWDAGSGEEQASLAHESPVYAVAFAGDRSRVATAGQDGHARVWDVDVAKQLAAFAHEGPLRALALSPDGRKLASAGKDGRVRIQDASSGASIASMEGHVGEVWGLAFSADGRQLASAGVDGSARTWSVATGEALAVLDHGEVVRAVAFSPDGEQLATASFDDDAAHLWELAGARRIASFRHDAPVVGVAFSPDGRQLASASWDGSARMWTLGSGHVLTSLDGHRDAVHAVAFSPDGSRVATAGEDNSVRLWDAASGAPVASSSGHRLDLVSVAFSPTDDLLASASWDGSVRLWSASSGSHVRSIDAHAGRAQTVVFSPDGKRLASAGDDDHLRIWSVETGAAIVSIPHPGPLADVMFSPDGEQVVSIGADQLVRVFDPSTGTARTDLAVGGSVTALAFSLDGKLVAVANEDRVIEVRAIDDKSLRAQASGHADRVLMLAFSPDGTRLASASEDKTARVWDVASGQELTSIPHRRAVLEVAFSPTGTRLATASADEVARLWEIEPRAWLSWGCAVLEWRQSHTEVTQPLCPPTSFDPRPRAPLGSAPMRVVTAKSGPEPELITVHGVELVRIPAGTLTMGSAEGVGKDNERPRHEVELDGFYLARTEVTNAQYALYLDANPEAPKPRNWDNELYNQPHQPVVMVPWTEALAYCEWAGLQLPTEAQWEYAARAGATTSFWFGDDAQDLGRFDWYRGNAESRTHDVGKKDANPFGIHDVQGNVWEWCFDAYEDYATPARPGDGLRRAPVGEASRVIRGGSRYDDAHVNRVAYRLQFSPTTPHERIGFRPARSLDVPSAERE